MQNFFWQRWPAQPQVSPHTVASYRDTLRLLLAFIQLDLQMKERCLRKLQSPKNKAKRFKPADRLLAFLEQL